MTTLDDQQSDQTKQHGGANPAADLIRHKIDTLYQTEPAALAEAKEVIGIHKDLTKHQAYMKKLTESGMALAEIQTAWHNYYQSLDDKEKHEVWQEFYAEHGRDSHVATKEEKQLDAIVAEIAPKPAVVKQRAQSVASVKKQLLRKSAERTRQKLSKQQHLQSLLFGLGLGSFVVLGILFSFFNERFIAPFVTPSKQVSSTPIIIDSSTTVSDQQTKVLIPKINVEIPVVYDEPSIEEKALQQALERGVVHYATTPNPGEQGNTVIFGHSSNNILNKGKYKFAFVLLSRLEEGDTFYLTKNGTRYAYRIYEKKIVKPTELGVLGNTEKPATATLITCDPPGTSLNRLVVVGEQISPDPGKNIASTATKTDQSAKIIPSNAPSLWQKIRNWFST